MTDAAIPPSPLSSLQVVKGGDGATTGVQERGDPLLPPSSSSSRRGVSHGALVSFLSALLALGRVSPIFFSRGGRPWRQIAEPRGPTKLTHSRDRGRQEEPSSSVGDFAFLRALLSPCPLLGEHTRPPPRASCDLLLLLTLCVSSSLKTSSVFSAILSRSPRREGRWQKPSLLLSYGVVR
jgi:hypothetical protein